MTHQKYHQAHCIIIPFVKDISSGTLIRSVGYAEAEAAISEYNFSNDGTFTLTTNYEQSIAEEKNLVCLRECALQVISFKNFSRVRSAANVVCIRSQTN